jgi:hypothetical protein
MNHNTHSTIRTLFTVLYQTALYKISLIQFAIQLFYLDIQQTLKLHTTIHSSLQENKPIMANHSSIINNYNQASKNANIASIQRGRSSGVPHASASRTEARERPNASHHVRAEPSTCGQDLTQDLTQELDQMEKVDLVGTTKTLLDDRIAFERQNTRTLENTNSAVRRQNERTAENIRSTMHRQNRGALENMNRAMSRTEQMLQSVQEARGAARAMQ